MLHDGLQTGRIPQKFKVESCGIALIPDISAKCKASFDSGQPAIIAVNCSFEDFMHFCLENPEWEEMLYFSKGVTFGSANYPIQRSRACACSILVILQMILMLERTQT
jgi:hypothetical protein